MDDDANDVGVDSGVESMGSSEAVMFVRVSIPELNIQKSLQFNPEDSVWKAKQHILSSIAKNIKEGFNYGFYCPPLNGRAGKFLDEERFLKEYSLPGPIGYLESNMKQLMEHVKRGECDKILKLLNRGMDPNFIEPELGETPLTLSCSLDSPSMIITTLVGGGAHLDFRSRKGFTPLHVAAQKGNEKAIKILLDLGSSANYKDLRGLTPLYLSVCNDVSARCVERLLYDHATLGVVDEYGWTELHQACKAGRVQHLELLIYYGADVNKQNSCGNTPLHISAINNQEECVRCLLFRGADKSVINFSNKDAYQCTIFSGNSQLSDVIKNFSESDSVPYQDAPKFNEKRRSIYPFNGGTLHRCRSNPQLKYESIDDIMLSQMNTTNDLRFIGHRENNVATMLGKRERRTTALPELSFFNERNSSSSHHFPSKSIRSLSISSAGSSQDDESSYGLKSSKELEIRFAKPRLVSLTNESSGYGFVLRGAKASHISPSARLNFDPSSDQPSLQYFEHVEKGGPAELAGILEGDYLLTVNGVDVTSACHDFTVSLIKNSPRPLNMLVSTPTKLIEAYTGFHDLCGNEDISDGTSFDLLSDVLSLTSKADPKTLIQDGATTDKNVASIRTVHGKRLACDIPTDEHDDVRIFSSSCQNANSLSRKLLLKAKSVQNISTGDDICYMFDISTSSPMNNLITSSSSSESKSENLSACDGFLSRPPPPPPLRAAGVKLSTFANTSKNELNVMKDGIKSLNQDIQSSNLISPSLVKQSPIKISSGKTENGLNFLALAEDARRMYLKSQRQQVIDDPADEHEKIAHESDLTGEVAEKNDSSDYISTIEISKLALVSNRRQIFECNGNNQIKSLKCTDWCDETDSCDGKVSVSTTDVKQKIGSAPPKPLQKSSNFQLIQSQIHSSLIPNTLPPVIAATAYSPRRCPTNNSMNTDESYFSIPPPPGFEDSPISSPTKSFDPKETSRKNSHNEKKHIEEWTVRDVASWLASIAMEEHVESFVSNQIDGKKLIGLVRKNLISLGVVQVGQRMNIERMVQKIRIAHSSSNLQVNSALN